MDSFFTIIIVVMLIFVLSILLFVYFTSTGIEENVHELKTELQKAQVPSFSPMGIFSSFMKFFLSFFTNK
jgi:uncharacterized BrkB/YihY/UPF0761 family membrane protein